MPLMNWVPKFIRRVFAYQPRHVVTAQEYNNDFNMLVEQGDHNAEALVDLRATVQSGNIVLGPESSINWGNIYGVPSMWPGDLSWDKILEAIETTYIDANGVWTPNVYAQNISTLYAKIKAAQIEDLEVGRNVIMGPGAAITWSQVTDPPDFYSETTIKGWIDAKQIDSAEIQALIEQYGMSDVDVATFINTMIANGEIATSQDLQDLAFQWADDVLALITATYIDANGVWTPRVYTQNLVAGTALIGDALIENIDADKITGDIGRFGSVTINNLTVQKGNIVELTVDEQDTSDMVRRYNLQPGDPDYALRKAPVKYQRSNDEVRERIVATYIGDVGGVESTAQVTNRAGQALYYTDAAHTGQDTVATAWPVLRFVYDGPDGLGLVKEREYFTTDGTNYIPAVRRGLGNGVGDNGTMTEAKWSDRYEQKYIATGGGDVSAGAEVTLILGDDGAIAKSSGATVSVRNIAHLAVGDPLPDTLQDGDVVYQGFTASDKLEVSDATLVYVQVAGAPQPTFIRCTGTTYSLALPTDAGVEDGVELTFKNMASGTVTLIGTVDGATNYALTTGSFCTLRYNGTDWDRIG